VTGVDRFIAGLSVVAFLYLTVHVVAAFWFGAL
jgi:hypothetical protein